MWDLKRKIKKVTAEILNRTDELEKLNKEFSISEQAISEATEGICITDIGGNIIKVNNSFCTSSGYTREELLGRNPRILKSGKQNKIFIWKCGIALFIMAHGAVKFGTRKNRERYTQNGLQ